MIQLTASVAGSTLTANPTAELSLILGVADTDVYVTQVSATVYWGDGQSTATGAVAAPYAPTTLTHVYSPGVYALRVQARNFKTVPEQAAFQQKITVTLAGRTASDAPPILYGPILPRAQGGPNAADWNFNLGKDSTELESDLQMLFLTACGERVFDPGYGSNLRRFIFALDSPELDGAVREEMTRAVALHVPLVEFVGAAIKRGPNRAMRVNAEFKSLLTQQALVLNLAYAP